MAKNKKENTNQVKLTDNELYWVSIWHAYQMAKNGEGKPGSTPEREKIVSDFEEKLKHFMDEYHQFYADYLTSFRL